MSLIARIKKTLSPDFSLDIAFETDGSACLGILGASGSGKSMTLKCIAGIETPDEGFIAVDGRTLFDSEKKINLAPRLRRVGYLFQNYALFPTMNLLENLTAHLSFPRAERLSRARLWLEKFGLGAFERRFPRELSGGQQQRAALARMLISRPAAVLLDEPFSALDAALREYMQFELAALLEGGPPDAPQNSILVTHERSEVFKLCPSLAVMERGRLLAFGKTRAVFDNPRTLRAALLTGCKNISAVERRGAREIFARDWGITLKTAWEVEDGITHTGIRAHSIRPARENATGDNEMTIAVRRQSDEAFEHTVLFVNAHGGGTGREIWWKYPRSRTAAALPEKLFFPPEELLPLRDAPPDGA